MGTEAVHDDLELFLTGWYRQRLAERPEPICADVTVDRTEPDPTQPFPTPYVVIHDFGGQDVELSQGEADVGISVLAGTKQNPADALELARIVHALRTRIPSGDPANPVAAVLSSSRPSLVQEDGPTARAYIPMTLSVVGREFI